MADKQTPPFFVGYLPMPAALKRFYWPLAVLLIAACGVAGYWVAARQMSTGPATWNTAALTTMEGILTLTPYPVLHRLDPERPGRVDSVLLVAPGKHSAHRFSAAFDGRPVAVEGNEIRRGDWTMLEVAGEHAIGESGAVPADKLRPLLEIKSLGEVALNGEIADSKCFLGVMKPGAGHVHKACAEICLLGGIPPMLVAGDARQRRFGYLVSRSDGSGAAQLLAPYAAQTVRISGRLRQQGDLLFIAMDDNGIRPM